MAGASCISTTARPPSPPPSRPRVPASSGSRPVGSPRSASPGPMKGSWGSSCQKRLAPIRIAAPVPDRGYQIADSGAQVKANLGDAVRVDGDRRLTVHDVVDQPVFARLLGRHEAVAVGILLEPLERLPGVLLVDLVELLLHPDEF